MATVFTQYEKLFAKRDGINVFALPNGGGAPYKWLYRPQRSAPGEGQRDYKRFDELGPFLQEVDIEGVTYLEIVSWDNVAPVIGNPYTVVRHVYVKAGDDAVITQAQYDDIRQKEQNDAAIENLKSTVYPEWKAQKIELPTDAYYQQNQEGNWVLYLKWANGLVMEYEKFKVLGLAQKKAAIAGANPDAGPEPDKDDDPGTGTGTGTGGSFSLYAIVAGLGMMVLFLVYIFLFKQRKHTP